MSWWRMHDAEPNGMLELEPAEAHRWNGVGFGIFATVQSFDGPRRIENLRRIRAWAVDLDRGAKAEQIARLNRAKLIPSSIVETKNGYHAYWYAADARKESYRALLDRLVAFFGADKRARDLARVLRVPGFLHLKDPADPFLVHHVYGPKRSRVYTERQMFAAFPAVKTESSVRHDEQRRAFVDSKDDDFWDRIYNLDCRDALERLSGTGYVGGEKYEFKRTARGTQNIVVDGKSTSCWIDENGRIGSLDGGGPTVVQWLAYFGTPKRECVRIVKELYPPLEDR